MKEGWTQPGRRVFGEKNPIDDPGDFIAAGFGCARAAAGCVGCLLFLVAVLGLSVVVLLGIAISR